MRDGKSIPCKKNTEFISEAMTFPSRAFVPLSKEMAKKKQFNLRLIKLHQAI